jgi:hypothetical protein
MRRHYVRGSYAVQISIPGARGRGPKWADACRRLHGVDSTGITGGYIVRAPRDGDSLSWAADGLGA